LRKRFAFVAGNDDYQNKLNCCPLRFGFTK
jgi:hypothetical protein